jgi:hypothetical protein
MATGAVRLVRRSARRGLIGGEHGGARRLLCGNNRRGTHTRRCNHEKPQNSQDPLRSGFAFCVFCVFRG